MKIPDARSLPPEAQEALRERVVHAIAKEGMSITEAASAFGIHRCTASGWYNAFLRHGENTHPLLGDGMHDSLAQRLLGLGRQRPRIWDLHPDAVEAPLPISSSG
jgi:transposase